MKLNLDNPAHVKICLLSEGIRIDANFFKYFTKDYMHNYYFYQKDNETKDRFPNHMILPKNICCGLNMDEKSNWLLTVKNNEFIIQKKDKYT